MRAPTSSSIATTVSAYVVTAEPGHADRRLRRSGWSPKWDLDAGLAVTWEWYERTLG
jgi:hypothetical protein